MADKIIENNQVSMMGKIAAGFTFSHQVFGEGFYMTELLVKRLSDSEDRIPVMVSERLVDERRIISENMWKSMDSSAHITAMRRSITVSCFQYSAEN